jgi:hypothetical protein
MITRVGGGLRVGIGGQRETKGREQLATFLRRLSQKLAMSSAAQLPETLLLQKDSKASFRALWKRELLEKHFLTYCGKSRVREGGFQRAGFKARTKPKEGPRYP